METESRMLPALIIEYIPSLSSRERIVLAGKFPDLESLAPLTAEKLGAILGKRPPARPWSMEALRIQAERALEGIARHGMGMLRFRDPGYPPPLRELYDPPSMLFFLGTLPPDDLPLAAIVGTRKATGAGQAAAFEAARTLGRNGVAVLSGLALGIDAAAHRGSLAGGGRTVAILGSGLDRVYPASNRDLARRILQAEGALVSEYPPGTPPYKWNFPARNRIMAGLARGTLVAEAPEGSGALITAQFALDLGRDLWVLGPSLASPAGAGLRSLAEQGAPVVESAAVILEEWGMEVKKTGGEATGSGAALARSLAKSLKLAGTD